MVKPTRIHKISISPEAVTDYHIVIKGHPCPRWDIKKQMEEYLDILDEEGRLSELCRYIRVRYFDEESNSMLWVFIYQDALLGVMQIWEVSGICLEEDWNADLEDEGQIRSWLKTKYSTLPKDDYDWVEAYRKRKAEEEEYQRQLEEENKKWK